MKSLLIAAAWVLVCDGTTLAASPEDFSAAINTAENGIDAYVIKDRQVSLITGSPFVPTSYPYTIPPGTPVIALSAAISPQHNYLYVIYEELSGVPNILIQYSIRASGLVENWAAVTDFNGSNDLNHVAYLQSLIATGDDIVVSYHYPWGPSAEIFSASGAVLAEVASDPSGAPVLDSVAVDPKSHFYYACFTNGGQSYVSIFNLTNGTLLQNSSEATFIASECEVQP